MIPWGNVCGRKRPEVSRSVETKMDFWIFEKSENLMKFCEILFHKNLFSQKSKIFVKILVFQTGELWTRAIEQNSWDMAGRTG
jgi:5-carboxymethyl-2-hydroxymuconate isomerase